MNDVWVSSIFSNYELGTKLGIRHKFYGHKWELPTHTVPTIPKKYHDALSNRHVKGETLEREDFPEASYVFSEKHFNRTRDLFYAGGFFAVKGKLAEVLSRFDLGTGGLIPYPIYQEDRTTPLEGPFFLINFGSQKQSFLSQESRKVEPFFTLERHGVEEWAAKFGLEDGDIAVSTAAREGADLWFEPRLRNMILMSGALVNAIEAARVKVDLGMTQCRVVGQEGDQ